MAEHDTSEFNTLTMDKITNGIGEKSIDAILDDLRAKRAVTLGVTSTS